VQEQSERHEHAGGVGQEPPGVLHHLQDGERVVLSEARLVERLPAVAQRLVERLAVERLALEGWEVDEAESSWGCPSRYTCENFFNVIANGR
jgi:hypothetical protein